MTASGAGSARMIDVEVVRITEDGCGAGVADAREVRVKGASVGERVRARVVRRRRGIWWALPEVSVHGSPRAPCSAFPGCGGCAMQHLGAPVQLEHKQRWLLSRLEAEGVAPWEVDPPVTGPRFGYRRKARLAARYLADKDEYLLGFRESFGSRVARLDSCPVLAAPFDAELAELKRVFGRLRAAPELPQVEIAAGDDGASLALRHLRRLENADRMLLDACGRRSGIQMLLQPAGYDSLARLDGAPERLLSYRLDAFGLCLQFGIADFVQVNAAINEKLVADAIARLAPGPGDNVLDLFCGLGNFTLPIARRGAHVLGVDGAQTTVQRAVDNAASNRLGARCRFRRTDLYQWTDTPRTLAGTFDKALVDPPRSGCGDALSLLIAPRVGRIVYVSCHPESFVRDAGRLHAQGFDLKRIGLFDMFPHTTHAETLAVFGRR